MTVIQRFQHSTQNTKELIVTRLRSDRWSVSVILLFPVDTSQCEERIPVAKRPPELFKIRFRVSNHHRSLEVPLECSGSADVQGDAMEPAAQQPGMAQRQGDDIETVLLQQCDESRLTAIDDDYI